MKIAIAKEKIAAEKRVAATPETVKKLSALGAQVSVVSGAGLSAAITDDAYRAAGAQVGSEDEVYKDADVIFRVRHPDAGEITKYKKGALLIGILSPYQEKDLLKAYASQGIAAMAMELVPRITRAQSMDVLSSQANLAGYRAVLEAAYEYGHGFPLLMTAACCFCPSRLANLSLSLKNISALRPKLCAACPTRRRLSAKQLQLPVRIKTSPARSATWRQNS
jgi:NAD(P) transhydrogenase subunit alpha